jgi:integrase
MYKRPGRRVWYASLSDTEKHISLKTEDEDRAREAFARLVAERGHLELASDEKSLADLCVIARERSKTNNTPKTAYERHLNLRRIVKWCEDRKVLGSRQIDKALIEDFKTARRFDQVGAARINAELNAWKRMMAIAVELNAAHPDVLTAFVRLREPRPEPSRSTRTRAQLRRLLACSPPHYRDMFRTALGSGLRDEELRHLEAADVRPREIAVTPKPGWTTKSYHYRTIPISAATRKAALGWIKARDGGLINIDKKGVWKVMQAACKSAKIDPTSLHELRRAWASHLYADGVPLKTISKWLGHGSVATTERYLRVTSDALPKGVKLPW